jgi:hypothetical protein
VIAGTLIRIKTRIVEEIGGTPERHGLVGCRRCSDLPHQIATAGAEIARLDVHALAANAGQPEVAHIGPDNITSVRR